MTKRDADQPAGVTQLRPPARTWAHDSRWPAVAAALEALRERGRFAVRIVDAECGAGGTLLHAVGHARALGFTAIEARGIDRSPALVGRARAAAARVVDAAIGVEFVASDASAALREEADMPPDLLLWHGATRFCPDAMRRAGCVVIGEPADVRAEAA